VNPMHDSLADLRHKCSQRTTLAAAFVLSFACGVFGAEPARGPVDVEAGKRFWSFQPPRARSPRSVLRHGL
jgi:hypothetical protein